MTDADRKDLAADMADLLKRDRPHSLKGLQTLGTDAAMSDGRYSRQMERIVNWLEGHFPPALDFEWLELEEVIERATFELHGDL